MHYHGAWIGANDSANLIADCDRHVPPTFGPGPHPSRGPGFRVFVKALVCRAGHSPKTMRDQIDGVVQDWELTTPLEKLVRQECFLRVCLHPAQDNLTHRLCLTDYCQLFSPQVKQNRSTKSHEIPDGRAAVPGRFASARQMRAFRSRI